MGTFIVLTGLSGIVFLIVRSMVKEKKQGRAGCGGDCSAAADAIERKIGELCSKAACRKGNQKDA